VCYDYPKIHSWVDLQEYWPSLPLEIMESQFKSMLSITLEVVKPHT